MGLVCRLQMVQTDSQVQESTEAEVGSGTMLAFTDSLGAPHRLIMPVPALSEQLLGQTYLPGCTTA